MTEFTPEYRAFIFSDEAQCLQKHIDIQLGTVVYSEHIDRMAAVSEVLEDPDNTNADFYATFEKYSQQSGLRRDEVIVLPTLRQLLGVIEGAGWRWEAEMLTERRGPGGRYTEYRIGAEHEEDKDSLLCLDNWEEGDLMLAAAKLAARAVEGKG